LLAAEVMADYVFAGRFDLLEVDFSFRGLLSFAGFLRIQTLHITVTQISKDENDVRECRFFVGMSCQSVQTKSERQEDY